MTIHAKIRPLGATCFLFGASLIAPITLAGSAENATPKSKPSTAKAVQTPSALRLESLEVRASKEKYLGGEPVVLTVSLINKSAKTASFLMLGPRLEFAMKREGKIAGLTYKGKDESKGDKVSYRSVAVGEKFEYQVVISRLFDMTRAGNYTITCFKYLKNENREPGADLVGPKIVFKDIKIAVSEQDVI